MIIDHNEDILKIWADSNMNLVIQARPGNGKTDKAKEIMNQMISSGFSILLLTEYRQGWRWGLDKSEDTLIGPYEAVVEADRTFKVDLLVIDDHRQITDCDFPIEKISYEYILILSDESKRKPAFFKGETVRLINWNNISGATFDDEKKIMYTAMSDDDNGTMLLAMKNAVTNEYDEIRFPIDKLKRLLLE